MNLEATHDMEFLFYVWMQALNAQIEAVDAPPRTPNRKPGVAAEASSSLGRVSVAHAFHFPKMFHSYIIG